MQWAQLTATLVALFTICSILENQQQAAAFPTLRTYRGVSPYKALAEGGLYPAEDEEPPMVMNPREKRHPRENWDPTLIPGANRLPYGGKYNHRPQWADRVVKKSKSAASKFAKFAARLGMDFIKLADISDPVGQVEAALDISKGHEIWESLDVEEGYSIILGNGTVLPKSSANAGMGALANVVDSGFDYANTPVRGVNIGNWLVMECWMDPGFCNMLNQHAVNAPNPNAIVDEWTAAQYSDYNYQKQVFEAHYNSWFTEEDMREIAAAGLNHVRIPVPFWAFGETNRGNEPYRTFSQYDHLIKAVGWAKKYGIKVWIDLHTVPGSANGLDNGGHTGTIEWTNDPDNISRTKYVFDRLVKTFNSHDWYRTVTAFEAINEPQGHQQNILNELVNDYYPWAMGDIKDNTKKRLLAFHDAFVTPGYWANYFSQQDKTRAILDTHQYFVYSDYERNANDRQRVREVCNFRSAFAASKQNYISVVGEMASSAPKGDNGQGRNLPQGKINIPNSGGKYSYDYHYFLAFNFRVQQSVFEQNGNGWIYWAWYNKGSPDWSYKTGIKYGWAPKNAQELSNNPLGNNPCSLVGL